MHTELRVHVPSGISFETDQLKEKEKQMIFQPREEIINVEL
jgi:hypothetical protein